MGCVTNFGNRNVTGNRKCFRIRPHESSSRLRYGRRPGRIPGKHVHPVSNGWLQLWRSLSRWSSHVRVPNTCWIYAGALLQHATASAHDWISGQTIGKRRQVKIKYNIQSAKCSCCTARSLTLAAPNPILLIKVITLRSENANLILIDVKLRGCRVYELV